MSIMDKLKKNSKLENTAILSESKYFQDVDMIPTDIPMLNVALSGDIDGGLTPGLTMLAGPSKHFKTSFALVLARSYLNKYQSQYYYFTILSSVLHNHISSNTVWTLIAFYIRQSKM